MSGVPEYVSLGSPKKWEGIWVNNLGDMNPCGQQLCKKTFQLNISVHYIEDVAAKKKRGVSFKNLSSESRII